MGHEVKRVPLDFDWPIGQIWPPYMARLCTEEVRYAIKAENEDLEVICKACWHAANLAGVVITYYGCPDWKIHPPAGEGYQLWETVSEGSPVSPVCATPDELADWLVIPGNDTSITKATTRDQWLSMIRGCGSSPTLVSDAKGTRPGVQL